jgi:putative membrane protein
MWWPILSPLPELPRLSYPAQMLYLILLSISQTPLFAVLTFSNSVIYSFYEAAPRVWGVSPLADQQIGGIVMKVSWMAVFVPSICIVFLRWFYREQAEGRPEFQPIV